MITATTEGTDTAKILWVDDQITAFESHIEALAENYEVIGVATAEEAMSTVRRGDHFDAILVDLKMPDSDGIALLEQLHDELGDAHGTHIIVLSSFLYVDTIRRRLVGLNMNVALLDKTPTPDGPAASLAQRVKDVLDRDDVAPPTGDQFTDWDQAADAADPFEITLEAYRNSPMVVRLQLDRKAQAATRAVRAALATEGVVWSCFCGSSEQPIMTCTEVAEIPTDDEIFSVASGKGHPPYEFFEQGEFEELTGSGGESRSASHVDDGCPGAPDYPFFRIGVVHRRHDDFSFDRARDFHFDTGLDMTAFDLEAALEIGLEVDTDKPAKFVTYSGVEHAAYTFTGDAYVDRGNRGSLQVTISGRAYPDWDESPFSRLCSDHGCDASERCFRRHALLGRNLLVENMLQLDLRSMLGTPRA